MVANIAPLRDLVGALRAAGVEADDGTRRRAEYSSDASNYRVVPEVVTFPRGPDEVLAIMEVSRRMETPLTARGGGTSIAGNSIGPGIVMDLSRHVNRIESFDPEARTAVVQPGVILGDLQRAGAPHGLRFGPDPSTWARCTIGGMIGNNACGPRALRFGRTADNVIALDVADGTGRRFSAAQDLSVVPGLKELVGANLDIFRTELGTFGRQISGYSLEHLLPENGSNLARALAGTEGSCAVVLGATVRLVDVPRDSVLVVLGYPDMATAADDVPALLPLHPVAIEGLDARILEVVRAHKGVGAVPQLPAGGGWLLVEIGELEGGDAMDRARRLVRAADTTSSRIIPPSAESRAIWRIREDGAGFAGRTADGRQAWPGVEDAAVPPENLGAYLRKFDELLEEYHFNGLPYGHFGDGCVHVRVDIPLEHDGVILRRFMEDAARLISSFGGSLSGEHGDGRARGELLRTMYSERMLGVFAQFKGLLDPADLLNPGVIVRPAPIDADLRRPAAPVMLTGPEGFAFGSDQGDITKAVHRCVGVGKCRADSSASGGVMCPSFLATKDEKDSTRGRARVLQELINGTLVRRDWAAPEVADSLDLCLSCKACSSDCPAGVDMAMLKSEVLHRRYRRRARPIAHYTLGWMPRWARLGASVAPLANAVISQRWIEKLVLRVGGMDSRRAIPRFARPFRSWWKRRPATPRREERPSVLLWVDSFSDNFSPAIGRDVVAVLDAAGIDVVVPERSACCGLTWISTGQLDAARRKLLDLLDVLAPYAGQGMPILGLEPSCTAVLRSDLLELLPDDPRAHAVSAQVVTLAELLASDRFPEIAAAWQRPDLTGTEILIQPHCHQHAVMGADLDVRLLRELGARVTEISGCCGLAGNFGMERGHYEVSVSVAENGMLPALRDAPSGSVLLADGLSCRTQAEQLGGVSGIHLAQLLVERAR